MDPLYEIQQLKVQIANLMKWKDEKSRQQLRYPIDQESKRILYKPFIWQTGAIIVPVGLINTPLSTLEVKVNNKYYWVLAGAPQ